MELRLESSLLEKTPSPGSACKGVLQSSDAAQLGAELESLSASWPGQRAPQVWQPPRLADHAAGLVKFERGRAVWRGPRNAIKHHEPHRHSWGAKTHMTSASASVRPWHQKDCMRLVWTVLQQGRLINW